ncbi:M56 family metallopeptidase [uncultured Pseudoteredinibacter sp.]|uniref:M56 family metallopeptidase n=1 Tax=uncultured Pseudoteredinibacter sp. TaxID=1641701 RepID=UPI0026127669|nr:M56 family metallopeptidase [uncultured Pseudoteredinibacter sp.]
MIAAALMLALKAGLICLLLLGCYLGLDKHSARLRYQWLSMAAALLFLFPFFDYALNSFSIAVAVRPSHFLLQNPVHFIQQTWVQYLLMVYCFVASWLLLYSIMGLLRLAQIEKQAKQANKDLNSRLEMLAAKLSIKKTPALRIHHSESMSPCTFGFLRSIVLLPANAESWPKAQLDLVLLHELAHIKHRDFLRINSARFLLAIYWFLPPLWWLLAELKSLSEQLADDTVLNAGANDADYAEVLMEAGRLHKQASAMVVAVNGNGEYYQRVMTVLDRYVDRAPQKSNASRPMFWFLLLIGLSMAAIDLEVHDKGFLKIPVSLVDVRTVSKSENEKARFDESLKVVAMATNTLPASQVQVSGFVDGDIQMPAIEAFEGIDLSINIKAEFNIDEFGNAYGVVVSPVDLSSKLKREIEKSIRGSQFSAYQRSGKPAYITGVSQEFKVSIDSEDD